MSLLAEDPDARAAVLDALAEIGAVRTRFRPAPARDRADAMLGAWAGEAEGIDVDAGGADDLPRYALALLAAIALDELDKAGGSSAGFIEKFYSAVTQGKAQRQ